MIASVRVSLTIVAISSVLLPWMPSHAEAAAVTDEVSLTAVPANRPKPWSVMPSMPPSVGKVSAAMTLNRKITEIACAISSSSAPMTGAVAAIAEPPQMDEPTPTSVEMLDGTFIALHSTNDTISEVPMVETMIGSDCAPTFAISDRLRPKPSRITAYCSTFFDVKPMPGCTLVLFFQNSVSTMPIRMENTGPPTTGTACPSSHAGIAMHRHSSSPAPFFLIKSIVLPPY